MRQPAVTAPTASESSARPARIGSMFTGMGGLDMAVREVFGGQTMWVADIEPGPSKVLEYRFPGIPNLGDVTTVDWALVPPVDILCGSSPCTSLSQAGRRAGMVEGTPSNLWVCMRDAIAQIQPELVVWENVYGALSAKASSRVEPCTGCVGNQPAESSLRALGRVLGDLAALGFDAAWTTVRAAEVGAPPRAVQSVPCCCQHPTRCPTPRTRAATKMVARPDWATRYVPWRAI